MNNKEENSLLGNFDYGLININNEKINLKEAEIELSWNEKIFDLIREVYPVVGRINLDLYQDKKDKICLDFEYPEMRRREELPYFKYPSNNDDIINGEYYPLDLLTKIMKYNDMVISLREYLYSEIEFNQINTNYENSLYGELLYKLGIELIRTLNGFEPISSNREINNCITELIMAKEDENTDKIKNLIDYMDSIIYINSFQSLTRRTFVVGEIIEAIQQSGIDKNFDRLWHIYLLSLYYLYLFNKPIEIGNLNFFSIDECRSFIRKAYTIIDNELIETQINNSQNMMLMYMPNKMSASSFTKHRVVKGLFDALNNMNLDIIYLRKGMSTKEFKGKCFAAMYDRNKKKKYAAISGTFDKNKYIDMNNKKNQKIEENDYPVLVNILKKILAGQYHIIDKDENVKYYFNIRNGFHCEITSKEYIDSVKPSNKIYGRRMFSCCERKLSTVFELGGEYDFYTKYSPCPLCMRMIEIEERYNRHFINIRYWQDYKDTNNWKILDDSARKVESYKRRTFCPW